MNNFTIMYYTVVGSTLQLFNKGSTFTRIFRLTTAGVKCCEPVVKSRQTSSRCCYFFSGPSGSMTQIHLVLRIKYRYKGRETCCTFHYLQWTDLISLQFSFLYFGLVVLRNFIHRTLLQFEIMKTSNKNIKLSFEKQNPD